jgi:thiol-disulfide isomerase/thioredoxin
MKIILTFLLSICISARIFSQEVQFETGTWNAILAKAQKENKPIFLDIYASWCGPCKLLDKNVYPDESVAEYMNTHFINAKFDGEESEGLQLVEQFGLSSYPTLYFIKPNGDKFYSFEGYRDPEAFLEEAESAIEMSSQPTITDFAKSFKEGKRDKEFLGEYLDALYTDNYENLHNAPIIDAYVATLSQNDVETLGVKRTLWNQLPSFRFGSNAYDFLKKNITTIKEAETVEDEEAVEDQVLLHAVDSYIAYYDVKRAIETKDETKVLQELKNFRAVAKQGTRWFSDPESSEFYLKREFYQATDNKPKIIASVEEEVEQVFAKIKKNESEPSTSEWANILNASAWYFFENTQDNAHLQKALTWSKKSIDLEPTSAYYDTYANLLFVLDQTDAAIEAQRKAIDIAYENEEDATEYWKTLLRMKEETNLGKELPAIEHTMETLKKDLASYLALTKEVKIDEFLDYSPAKLFEIAPQEQLCDIFYKTYNSKELPIRINNFKVLKHYDIFPHGNDSYTLIKYSTELLVGLAVYKEENEEDGVDKLLKIYEMQFGKDNMKYDKDTEKLSLIKDNFMYCIAEEGDTSWKFVNRDKQMIGLLNSIIPKEIQDKFD